MLVKLRLLQRLREKLATVCTQSHHAAKRVPQFIAARFRVASVVTLGQVPVGYGFRLQDLEQLHVLVLGLRGIHVVVTVREMVTANP